jgi:hypothetical protein
MITIEEFKKQNEELIQDEILRRNRLQLEIFADKVYRQMLNNKLYEIDKFKGNKGFELIHDGKSYIKNDIQGIYVIYLVSILNGELIVIYIGETDYDVSMRLGRLIVQAKGYQHPTESHSGGQLLFDKFTSKGRQDIWEKNLRVQFITLDDIKINLGGTSYSITNLEGTEYRVVREFANKKLLQFFESEMIDRFAPISNKNSHGFYNHNKYQNNWKLFNDLCNLVQKDLKEKNLKEKKFSIVR